jgi:hypothetical protein
MDRYKTPHTFLISHKKPRSFIRNGVFASQFIFPSSIVIRDGTISTAFLYGGSISQFSFEIYNINDIFQFTTFRKNIWILHERKISRQAFAHFILYSIACSENQTSTFVFVVEYLCDDEKTNYQETNVVFQQYVVILPGGIYFLITYIHEYLSLRSK